MHKAVIVAVVVLVCLPALLSAAKGGSRRNKAGRVADSDCGPWVEGQCIFRNNAACGIGSRNMTRTGDNCSPKEKTVRCKVPCTDSQSGAAGASGVRSKGRNNKQACKYTKGDWSECDAATNTKTRTLTLKASNRRNASPPSNCEQTKVVTKRCAANKKGRRGHGNQ